MVKLDQIMNIDTLEDLILNRFISRKFHSKFPLAILNYSHLAQYSKDLVWGPEMSMCRGLIYRIDTLEVIARPFAKFWNLNDERHPETLENNLPIGIPLLTTKMDGSLGILYNWADQNYVATRGSFESDQAQWATEWLQKKYPRLKLPKEYTLLTEIIYPENQIVVYYDFSGLIVLGAVHNTTGVELSRSDLKSYCVANEISLVKDHKKTLLSCADEDIPNQEGYVATFSNGFKVKIKFSTYCSLHRILTGLNPHTIWEMLRDGKGSELDTWLIDEKIPNDFKKWLMNWTSKLGSEFNKILFNANEILSNLPINLTRKEIAEYFLQSNHKYYSAILFGMLDNRDISNTIWKLIEPKATDTFKEDGE